MVKNSTLRCSLLVMLLSAFGAGVGSRVQAAPDGGLAVTTCQGTPSVQDLNGSGSASGGSYSCVSGVSGVNCRGKYGRLSGLISRNFRSSAGGGIVHLEVGKGHVQAYVRCGKGFISCAATPGHPCEVRGQFQFHSMRERRVWFESKGDSESISYTIAD